MQGPFCTVGRWVKEFGPSCVAHRAKPKALREFLEFGQAIRPLESDLEARLQLAAADLEGTIP